MARARKQPAALALEIPTPEQSPRYYVVNPHGAVHEVTQAHLRDLVARVGYREATADEVAELARRGGEQMASDPIGRTA